MNFLGIDNRYGSLYHYLQHWTNVGLKGRIDTYSLSYDNHNQEKKVMSGSACVKCGYVNVNVYGSNHPLTRYAIKLTNATAFPTITVDNLQTWTSNDIWETVEN